MASNNSHLLKVLTDVGLSSNQAQVYLAALTLGPSRPVDIARKAGVKRPTVYPVIESLQKLGLMSEELRGFKKLFRSEKPEKLEAIVNMRHQELKRSLKDLSSIADKKSSESVLRYFEGVDAVKEIFGSMIELVQPGDDYMIISNTTGWYEMDPEFIQYFIERRAKLDINIRCILWDSKVGRDYEKNKKKYNLDVRLLPEDNTFSGSMVIIPQRLWISHNLEPAWGTIIEQPNIIKFYQQFFESWWRSLN